MPALVEAFVRRFNIEEGKRVAGASPATLAMLTAFAWPGNVRQLENAVYRAIVLSDDPHLQPHDFPSISGLSSPPAVEPTAAVSGEQEAQAEPPTCQRAGREGPCATARRGRT